MLSFAPELTRRASRAFTVVALAAATLPVAQAAGVPGQGTWETTLQGRDLDGNLADGYEAYYDTALNITWLADADYAKTVGYSPNGQMNWNTAKTWVANLNVNGVTGWRLPTMVDTGLPGCDGGYSGTDCGYNVSTGTSEMAHMFYVTWGNKGLHDTSGNSLQPGWGLTNTGPFKNVQANSYWFGVEYAPGDGNAWYFNTYNGSQGYVGKIYVSSVWAVHSGDVAAVPEPQANVLALIGFTALLIAAKRRRA